MVLPPQPHGQARPMCSGKKEDFLSMLIMGPIQKRGQTERKKKRSLKNSKRLPDVVAGLSELGYELFGVVVTASFEVELDAADLEGVLKVQAIVEDV